MSVTGSVRDRRSAETVGEIKGAALEQLATAGTGGLSLRGVARAVGMTVQSLYHYFDSRDALLSALVTDSHHALADAAEAAAAGTRGQPPRLRRLADHRRVPGLGAGEHVGVPAALRHPGARLRPRPRVRERQRGAAARRAVRRGAVRRVDARPGRGHPVAGGRRATGSGHPGRRAAARCARAVHRDARAHARAGDAGAPGPSVAVRRTSASSSSPPRWAGCPTSSTRCKLASEAADVAGR